MLGIQHVSPVDQFPVDQWNQIMNVNLNAAFHTIRLALPHMKGSPQKFGRIINISSVHGIVASANKSAYVAAKHGNCQHISASSMTSQTNSLV
jgi:3-hydroxybutyrate dehydrogenase